MKLIDGYRMEVPSVLRNLVVGSVVSEKNVFNQFLYVFSCRWDSLCSLCKVNQKTLTLGFEYNRSLPNDGDLNSKFKIFNSFLQFKLNSSYKSLKTTLYNFFFYYFEGIGYKLFINKINYFLLCPFFLFWQVCWMKSKSTCGIK